MNSNKPKNKLYVALLRGINVGGNNKVEMPRLKKTFESLGFANVSTYINTGNIFFETSKTDPSKLAEKIEKALEKTFGFPIKIVLRDAENIQKLHGQIPGGWKNDEEQKTDVLFLWDEFDAKNSVDLISINAAVDTLKYVSGSIVWNVKRSDYAKSGMPKFAGTKIYKNMTARNVNTVRKMFEIMTEIKSNTDEKKIAK